MNEIIITFHLQCRARNMYSTGQHQGRAQFQIEIILVSAVRSAIADTGIIKQRQNCAKSDIFQLENKIRFSGKTTNYYRSGCLFPTMDKSLLHFKNL